MSAAEDLREAYLAFGQSITCLQSMRLHSGAYPLDTDAINAAHRHADEGNRLAHAAGQAMRFTWKPAVFRVRTGPEALVENPLDHRYYEGSTQACNETIEVIGFLRTVRERLALEMRSRRLPIPDDLPEFGELEQGFGTGRARSLLHWLIGFGIVGWLVYAILVG